MAGDLATPPRGADTAVSVGKRRPPRRLALLGPAFVAAVAYVDPGNFATNFSAGASEGGRLLWVVVTANAMAAVIQYLSARLGAASGVDLAAACREHWPRPVVLLLWAVAELVCAATDLAEVVGAALALRMLCGLPLPVGGLLTGGVAFAVLAAFRRRQQGFERLMAGALAVILFAFAGIVALSGIPVADLGRGLVPGDLAPDTVLLVTGIVGATVMPHAIYVHSAFARRLHRAPGTTRTTRLRALRGDVAAAMATAGLGNAVILAAAAALLYGRVSGDISLDGIHRFLGGQLPAAAPLFAGALLVSGLAASGVGTYAGQIVMRGFLRISVPLTLRRLLTLLPALVVLAVGVDPTRALVLSQVGLSFGIPFALVPLLLLTRRADVMGDDVAPRALTLVAGGCAAVIIALNCALLLPLL